MVTLDNGQRNDDKKLIDFLKETYSSPTFQDDSIKLFVGINICTYVLIF